MSSKQGNRDLSFERRMSDAEALMWNIEKDPWLNPSGAMVSILDSPLDVDGFRQRIMHAVADIARLREKVIPAFGSLAPPTWAADPEFDLEYHIRHVSLPAPGSNRQLLDLATRFYEDPFDRTRPLWAFLIVEGLADGRGAIVSKMHHSITDGIGAMRLSERYIELTPDAEAPEAIDLDPIIAAAVAADSRDRKVPSLLSPVESVGRTASHTARRQMGIVRRALGEVASWAGDPHHAAELASETIEGAKSMLEQLVPSGEDAGPGSPLFQNRSRRRHLEAITVPLDAVKETGKALGGSVNDVFLTAAALGALEYHSRRETPVDGVNMSFVVSTRTGGSVGGNSFTPVQMRVDGAAMDHEDRLQAIRAAVVAGRESLSDGGPGLNSVAGVAAMLPTSVLTQMARARAATIDIATSNMRGAPIPTYMSGAKVLQTITMGPVAGTACNMTALSYDGNLDIGLFIDPAAIDDPDDFRDCVGTAYEDLFAAAGVDGKVAHHG